MKKPRSKATRLVGRDLTELPTASQLLGFIERPPKSTRRKKFSQPNVKTMATKFFKTIVQVEVLSEDTPYECEGITELDDLRYAVVEGHCSGVAKVVSTAELSGPDMAKALLDQGSDPSFFGLDADGNTVEA